MIKLALQVNLSCVLSGYAPQSGLTAEDKTMLYDDLLVTFMLIKIIVSFLHAVTSMEILEQMKLVMKAHMDGMVLAI